MKRILLFAAGLVVLLSSIVVATVPQLINFQGVLRDGSGNPVANGSYSVQFTIYDAATGGTNLWQETQSVSTNGGLFTVLLGSGPTPLDYSIFNDSTRWLGVKVGADPEMSPRQRLSSVGYSHNSAEWTSAAQDLFRLNGNVGIGTPSPGAKLDVQIFASEPFAGVLSVRSDANNAANGDVVGVLTRGTNSSAGRAFGILGTGSANSGDGYGGYFQCFVNSGPSYGVYGSANSSSNGAYGGYFVGSSGATSYGVYAVGGSYGVAAGGPTGVYATGGTNGVFATGGTNGVYGTSGFIGVRGDGGTYGVYGVGSTGVYAFSSSGPGVVASGTTNGVEATGSTRGVYATGGSYGAVGVASANGGAGIYGSNGGNSATWAGYFSGDTYCTGNWTVAGSKSATVKVDNGEYRLLYAQESPENWFEDFGTARLVNGKAIVTIDPLFDQTVNTAVTYHVFLTPKGDCRGLYVTNETPSTFEIRELQNGKSDLSVSYRIVAKRKGYENTRLAKLEGQTPEEVQAKDVKLRAEMAKENALHQEEQTRMEQERKKMEAERKQVEEQRAKMEQERLIQEQKNKENQPNK